MYYIVIINESQILYFENETISSEPLSANFTYNSTANHTQVFHTMNPSYKYTVTMAAVTSVGRSPYSDLIIVTMPTAGM